MKGVLLGDVWEATGLQIGEERGHKRGRRVVLHLIHEVRVLLLAGLPDIGIVGEEGSNADRSATTRRHDSSGMGS